MNRRTFLRQGSLWVAAGLVTADTLDRWDWQRFRRIFALGAPLVQYDSIRFANGALASVCAGAERLPVAYIRPAAERHVVGLRNGVWETIPRGTQFRSPSGHVCTVLPIGLLEMRTFKGARTLS